MTTKQTDDREKLIAEIVALEQANEKDIEKLRILKQVLSEKENKPLK